MRASPYARKRARELGVALESVRGTGPGGRIVAADVEQGGGPSRVRAAMAKVMSEAKATIPHFYLTVDVDAAPLLAWRGELTVTDVLVRACAFMLRDHPDLCPRGESGVAVAVAVPGGVVAPVVRGADTLSLAALAEAVHSAVDRARRGRLRSDDLSGAAMTVSNLGMFGIDEFAAIITPPQASVLAVGRVRDEAVVVDGAVVPGRRMRLTLSVDHRVTDGAQAGQALADLRRRLEQPDLLGGRT